MRIVLNVFLALCLLCTINSCTEKPEQVEKKLLSHPNPTSYAFNIPMRDLRDKLVKIFDVDPQMDNKTLEKIFRYKFPETKDGEIHQAMFEPETADSAAFGDEYFKQPDKSNNIF